GIPRHGRLVRRSLQGSRDVQGDLKSTAAEIDAAFGELEAADAAVGVALQFTDEGLGKRQRQHVRVATVPGEGEQPKSETDRLDATRSEERHGHLVEDVRTMITHAGDTSNLILDPDLDSYYLMDITLLALPQTQARLAAIIAEGEQALLGPQIT